MCNGIQIAISLAIGMFAIFGSFSLIIVVGAWALHKWG